jgi:putative CocE/NonD family hydrolase
MIDCGSGVRLERAQQFTLSDGVALMSDHYYPPGPGPHPTLLMRQPYGRDIASTVVYAHPVWFAAHGYNVVIQDVRGRGDSEGEFYPFRNEGRDGAETIRWLRTRSESNGSVGMYGFSYQGMTQLLAAAEQPEGLACIAPAQTASDLYHGWFYHQGALRLASSLGWGLQMMKADARRRKLRDASDGLEKAWTDLRSQPLITPYGLHPQLQHEGMPGYVQDWFTHPLPGPYWSALDVSRSLKQIKVPALHLSGWFDTYLSGSVAGFLALAAQAEKQYLVAGPWVHIPWGELIGDQNLGPDALLDTDSLLLRWFNHWLKQSGEFDREPRIRHFALGVNRWFETESFPQETLALYLHSGGRADSRKGDGALSTAVPDSPDSENPRDVFVYDPEVPVAAPGIGPANQAQLELGNNLLVYTSDPLQEPVHVLGSPQLTLYCVTSAAHADFTGKLVRLRPSGQADFVCIGIARSSYLFRDSGYRADVIHRWEFSLEPTSFVFAAGDAIRLEVASGAFPLYDRNPSTEVQPWLADSWNWQRSTQMVLHDAQHPSRLELPVC